MQTNSARPLRLYRLLFVLFILSGMSSLIYQVVWLRKAFAEFGIVTPVLSTVVSFFMLGLAAGSWLGGILGRTWRSRTSTSPLLLYGYIETAIGAGALLVPSMFAYSSDLLLPLGQTDSAVYMVASAAAIGMVIFPCCLCMGMTLPVMMAFIKEASASETSSFSFLYMANTIGALLGVSLTAVALIELFGFFGSLSIAACANLSIGACSLLIARRCKKPGAWAAEERNSMYYPAASKAGESKLPVRLILFLTGFSALALEVVWTRAFTPILSTTIYAFSFLLFLYLIATWAGTSLYRKHLQFGRPFAAPSLLAFCLLTSSSAPLLNDPRLFLGVAGIILIVVPFCGALGYLTSLLIDAYSQGEAKPAGRAYAINVLGCILGPLFAGYVFLPRFGVKWSMVLLTLPFLLLSLEALRRRLLFSPAARAAFYCAAALLVVASAAAVSFEEPFLYLNGEVRRDHVATVISTGSGTNKRLLVNGQGITVLDPVTKIMAHLPLMLLEREPESGLVICFGMGTTYRSLVSWGVEASAVELVPSVRDAFGYYHADFRDVLAYPKGEIVIDDGRRYLERTAKHFDVITIDPPPPVETEGSGLLYSLEFNRIAGSKLNPGGILHHWFPPGEPAILEAVACSLKQAFSHLKVFQAVNQRGHHFIAANKPIRVPAAVELAARIPQAARKDLLEWNQEYTAEGLIAAVLAREVPLESIISGNCRTLVSDDRPFNEYFLIRRAASMFGY